MLSGILPTLPAMASLLPAAVETVGAAPAAFAQLLSSEPAKDKDQTDSLVVEFASQHGVNDAKAPLNRSGLPRTVQDGEFTVHVQRAGGLDGSQMISEERRIRVTWPDERDGTSLQDIAAALNEIPGLKASIAEDGRLVVTTTDKSARFRFGEDTSGLLEALGTGKTPLHQAFDKFVGNSLYGQMLSSMRKTQGKPAYFHGGRTEEIFQGQLDQRLVDSLTAAKGGELADAMYQQQFNSLRR